MLVTTIASHTAIQIQAAPPVRTTADLEHVVIAVRDLTVATTSYERLGFTVTPGRGILPEEPWQRCLFPQWYLSELLTFYVSRKAADLPSS